MTNLIHKEEIKKIKASEKNENQFLEKSNENNELNSKNLYIHYMHIIWSWIKRNQRMIKILRPQEMRFFVIGFNRFFNPNTMSDKMERPKSQPNILLQKMIKLNQNNGNLENISSIKCENGEKF